VLHFDRSAAKHALQNTQNDCHQWLSHSFRVHQIRFRPGLCPGSRWGSLQCSPRPPSWIKGAILLRGRRGEGRREGGKGREGTAGKGMEKEKKGMEEKGPPFRKFLDPPLRTTYTIHSVNCQMFLLFP